MSRDTTKPYWKNTAYPGIIAWPKCVNNLVKAPIKNKGPNSRQTWRNNKTFLWSIKDSAIRYRRTFPRDKAWTMLTYSFNSSNSGTSNNNTNSKWCITNNGWASNIILFNRKAISEKVCSKNTPARKSSSHGLLITKNYINLFSLSICLIILIIKNFILWKNS